MKTLKENLLADIDNSLEQGDKDIKYYNCFGRVFKLRRTVLTKTGVIAFSATGLKKLNKNLDYIIILMILPQCLRLVICIIQAVKKLKCFVIGSTT